MHEPELPSRSHSVVVAASNVAALLEVCLASLHAQEAAAQLETIVVSNYEAAGSCVASFPSVTHVAMPPGTTVPALRARGLAEATGTLVTLTEDNVRFDAGWSRAVQEAVAGGHSLVGGTVEQVPGASASDWAVYLYEYGRYMAPQQAGPVAQLPGNNVTYARNVLEALKDTYAAGFYEVFVHEEAQRRGYRLQMVPDALVHHIQTYHPRTVVRQCYHHGRGFAGMRVAQQPWPRRLVMACGALVLPVLLPFRIITRAWRTKRHRRALVRAIPYLILYMSAWALGEGVGYAAGPGTSLQAWS